MLLLSKPAGRFRLVVQRDDCDISGGALVFDRYKEAVAHVARAVCDHTSEYDFPDTVVLQRFAEPAHPPHQSVAGSDSAPPDVAATERWLNVERWGTDVIRRIVQQRQATRRQAAAVAAWSAVEYRRVGTPDQTVRPRPVSLRQATSRQLDAPSPANAQPALQEASATPLALLPAPAARSTGQTRRGEPASLHSAGVRQASTAAASPRTGVFVLRRARRRHRESGRWGRRAYVAVAALMLALGWVAIVLWMTGGHPSELIRGMETATDAAPATEVHFDAPPPPPHTTDR